MIPKYYYLIIDEDGRIVDSSCDKIKTIEYFNDLVGLDEAIAKNNRDNLKMKRIVYKSAYSIIRYKIDKVVKKWDRR